MSLSGLHSINDSKGNVAKAQSALERALAKHNENRASQAVLEEELSQALADSFSSDSCGEVSPKLRAKVDATAKALAESAQAIDILHARKLAAMAAVFTAENVEREKERERLSKELEQAQAEVDAADSRLMEANAKLKDLTIRVLSVPFFEGEVSAKVAALARDILVMEPVTNSVHPLDFVTAQERVRHYMTFRKTGGPADKDNVQVMLVISPSTGRIDWEQSLIDGLPIER